MQIDLLESRTLLSTQSPAPTCENIGEFLTTHTHPFDDNSITFSKVYNAGHISNLGTLARVSTVPILNTASEYCFQKPAPYQEIIKGALWLIEGGAYALEYYFYDIEKNKHHAHITDSNDHTATHIDHYQNASWSQIITTTWLGLWGTEAIFYILSNTLLKQIPGSEAVKQIITHTTPLISNSLLLTSLYNDWTLLDNSRLQQQMATRLSPENPQDIELKQIIEFINNAQEPHEARFLMICDAAKFIGNLASMSHILVWLSPQTQYPMMPYMQTLATRAIWTGSLGYALYGISQVIEWGWDQTITLLARYTAAIHLLGGDQQAAKHELLEADPHFMMKRLIERLQAEAEQPMPITTVYLKALGVDATMIEQLIHAESCDPNAQTYLAEKLNIYL